MHHDSGAGVLCHSDRDDSFKLIANLPNGNFAPDVFQVADAACALRCFSGPLNFRRKCPFM